MALSNLSGWAGSSCGASDNPPPAVHLTSRLRLPPLAARPANRRKSPLLAVLPAALATSNSALSPGKARPLPGDFPNTIGFGRFSYEGNMI